MRIPRAKSRLKKIAVIACVILILFLLTPVFITSFTRGVPLAKPAPSHTGQPLQTPAPSPEPTLTVMTLNLAHGRSNGRHQALTSSTKIHEHLDAIAELVQREKPGVAAFQEADGPSWWSGNFNHVEYLAEKSEYPFYTRAENVKGLGISFGTALMSNLSMTEVTAVSFAPTPLTFTKGFILAAVDVPSAPPVRVHLASVHLDFSQKKNRKEQTGELVKALEKIPRPLIVLGDFNCEFSGKDDTLRNFADAAGLVPYRPDATDMITFKTTKARIDWILISPDLEFTDYRILPDVVSDHQPVVAQVRLKTK